MGKHQLELGGLLLQRKETSVPLSGQLYNCTVYLPVSSVLYREQAKYKKNLKAFKLFTPRPSGYSKLCCPQGHLWLAETCMWNKPKLNILILIRIHWSRPVQGTESLDHHSIFMLERSKHHLSPSHNNFY